MTGLASVAVQPLTGLEHTRGGSGITGRDAVNGAHASEEDLVVKVAKVQDLFVAPDTDPLAQHEGEVMGEPALLRVVRRLLAARKMRGGQKLVVVLPADTNEPNLTERVRAALVRYCALKLEDNDAQLQLLRRQAGRLLLRGILILAVCVGLSSLFRGELITFLPPLIKNALGEGFNVIGWVMLWRPVEAYFFDPLPLRTSSAVHRFLSSLRIEIRAQQPPADRLTG